MIGTMRRLGAAAAALLALAGPAQAQRHVSSHGDGATRHEVRLDGEVELTDDDRGVARLSPGGRLVIEEAARGRDRRVEWRATDGGGVRMLYAEDGETRVPDADDRAWIERQLRDAIRESGVGAEQRVARILARGGARAVLDEIGRIRSDGAKRRYYTALLRSPRLDAEGAARALRHAGGTIGSDGDLRLTLAGALEARRLDAAGLAALLDAGASIESDGDRSLLLRQVAGRDPLAEARVREAFFRTAAGVGSDGDLALVLTTVLRREATGAATVAAALRAARGIGSDGDLARVLTSVPAAALREAPVSAAYREAMGEIESDGDRRRAAVHLARSLP
jgi:hypothetical protein